MTYKPHVLLQWGGDLTAGEIWSNGLRLMFTGPLASLVDRKGWAEENLEDIAADVVAFVARADSHLGTKCKLRFVKLNPIGADGRYEDEGNTIVKRWDTTPYPSGTGGVYLPHQVATVATLATDTARGKASKGRIYLPTASVGIQDSDQMMSPSDATAIATSVKTLVQDLNNAPGIDSGDPEVHVMSRLGDPGPSHKVTDIVVDTRLDVQRRRGNAINAPRYTVAVPG